MNPSNPRESDAILGGQTPPPVTGAILGGLAGAKQRLESETLVARLSALTDAFQYGEQGIELTLQALDDPAEEVQRFACRLLRDGGNEQGKQALLKRKPLNYFKTLTNWRFETYNPQVGIADPVNNAYVVRMGNTGRVNAYDLSQFEALLNDPRISELEALVFQIDRQRGTGSEHTFSVAMEAICEAKASLPNLKALFIGDSEGDRAPEFKKSKLMVFDIRPLLESFPRLEVLHVFGYFGWSDWHDSECTYILTCEGLRHENLKTLIIETADIRQENIQQLCSMDLPNLEYFELWFGRDYHYNNIIDPFRPILDGHTYPNIKYLGLCSSEAGKKLVQAILESPISDRLAIIDLKMGTLADADLEPLLNNSAPIKFEVLNITGNKLSDNAIAQLAKQPYQVISDYQFGVNDWDDDDEEDYESRRMNRHSALYE
jgi:hypothetical protein